MKQLNVSAVAHVEVSTDHVAVIKDDFVKRHLSRVSAEHLFSQIYMQ